MKRERIEMISRRATALLCVGLMAQLLLIQGGCGTAIFPSSAADRVVLLALSTDHPISQALEGTIFANPTALEIDPGARTFRLVFANPDLQLEGRFEHTGSITTNRKSLGFVGGESTITNLIADNGVASAEFHLNQAKRIVRIATSAGLEWAPTADEPFESAGAQQQVPHSASAYGAANVALFEMADTIDGGWLANSSPIVGPAVPSSLPPVSVMPPVAEPPWVPGSVIADSAIANASDAPLLTGADVGLARFGSGPFSVIFIAKWVFGAALVSAFVFALAQVLEAVNAVLNGTGTCASEGGACDDDNPCCTGLACEGDVCVDEDSPATPETVDSTGGVFRGTGGVSVTVPPGAVDEDTPISVAAVSEADLGAAVPSDFTFVGGAALDIGDTALDVNAELAVPRPQGVPDDAEILVARIALQAGTSRYIVIDDAVADGESIVSLAPAFPGIVQSGTYCFLWPQAQTGWAEGQITLDGEAVPQAVALVSGGFFMGMADSQGNYTVLVRAGNFIVTAFDPATGAFGQEASFLPSNATEVSLDVAIANDGLVVNTSLENGSFESGDLGGWSFQGAASVVEALGPITPYDGNRMAMISNGDGAVDDTSSRLEQAFAIPADADTLTLRYNFVTEEYPEYVDAGSNDVFMATLRTVDGPVEIVFEQVGTVVFEAVGGIDFPEGDDTVGQTGWQEVTIDVSPYAGTDDTVTLTIHDVGDAVFDSVLLIDGIALGGG